MRHWIFDLDGTLVDSLPSYTRVLTEVAMEFGVTLSIEDREQVRHLILPKFLERVLKPDQIEPAFKKVIAINLARQAEIPIFIGIDELLGFLHSSGCVLSVFTARERVTAQGILKETGLHKYFSHVVTRDCVSKCKPHPDGIHHLLAESKIHPKEAVMIGDHSMDMESAKSAGINGISVSWDGGPSHAKGLSDYHFTKISELRSWAAEQTLQSRPYQNPTKF